MTYQLSMAQGAGAGDRRNGGESRARCVHELRAEERDAAVEAYTRLIGEPPEFGFAPDRGWIEGFCAARFETPAIAAAPELLEALTNLLKQTNTIEVLGEWEATDTNASARKTYRARVDETIAKARAAIAKAVQP